MRQGSKSAFLHDYPFTGKQMPAISPFYLVALHYTPLTQKDTGLSCMQCLLTDFLDQVCPGLWLWS